MSVRLGDGAFAVLYKKRQNPRPDGHGFWVCIGIVGLEVAGTVSLIGVNASHDVSNRLAGHEHSGRHDDWSHRIVDRAGYSHHGTLYDHGVGRLDHNRSCHLISRASIGRAGRPIIACISYRARVDRGEISVAGRSGCCD